MSRYCKPTELPLLCLHQTSYCHGRLSYLRKIQPNFSTTTQLFNYNPTFQLQPKFRLQTPRISDENRVWSLGSCDLGIAAFFVWMAVPYTPHILRVLILSELKMLLKGAFQKKKNKRVILKDISLKKAHFQSKTLFEYESLR